MKYIKDIKYFRDDITQYPFKTLEVELTENKLKYFSLIGDKVVVFKKHFAVQNKVNIYYYIFDDSLDQFILKILHSFLTIEPFPEENNLYKIRNETCWMHSEGYIQIQHYKPTYIFYIDNLPSKYIKKYSFDKNKNDLIKDIFKASKKLIYPLYEYVDISDLF